MRLFQLIVQLFNKFIGAATIWEHRERPPPEMEKFFVEKWYYFRKLYFLQQLFQKSLKIQFSYSIFIKNFRKFLKVYWEIFSQQLLDSLSHLT